MSRSFAILLLPLVLLLAACSGGGGEQDAASTPGAASSLRDADGDGIYDSSTPADVADDTVPVDGDNPVAPPPAVVNDPPADPIDGPATDESASFFDTINPFELLDAAGAANTGPADPALAAALIRAADLPAGYFDMGQYSYSVPSEYGDLSMAVSIYASGGILENGEFGSMVMSAVMNYPPALREEFGDLEELTSLSEDDLADLTGYADLMGISIGDLRILDASGLGEGGVGMHLVMDFGGLLDAFGGGGDNPLAGGLAVDMFIFVEGDRVLMSMVMWAGSDSAEVDARALAEIMNARS
jgi:hypothetical protein